MRTLTYYVAATQDGFIAGPDGEIDAFEQGPELLAHIAEHYPETLPTPARAHLGIDDAPRRFDAVIMGRATYDMGADQGLTSPYAHLDHQIVCSTTLDTDVDPAVEVRAGDPAEVVRRLKQVDGLGVWLCGGGVLAGALIDEIDELVIKRQPMVLGAGRPLFAGGYAPTGFEPVDRTLVGRVAFETYRRAGS
ncbi:MAG: dihydrofolate reductase family protein [Actinomycetota bacterium]